LQQVFKLRLIEGASSYREQVYEAQSGRATTPAAAMRNLSVAVADMTASLRQLKKSISPEKLAQAVDLLRAANHIYVAGLRRSRPVAAYLAYGLMRVERPCSILDFDGGMAAQQVANMRPDDVLAAVGFAEYSQPVVDVVRDAFLRGIPVLAITDLETSPLSRSSAVSFLFDDAPTASFRPIAGPIVLVQAITITLSTR
jgi:DNA-binding MurR/RpiR family transcriptional regulator